ncbi:formate dehydrogenase accessory sulfurtransferase FdhD [Pseudaminobacter sp. NGMCC 1.201702]|uniref:formate dehydrogenase accessory sulfurtransferase FdhD n=1 Tax=Pseudaminobacter sp. NGMCC 1.201702 TaxID=3391825 RepID=UPI0039EF0893
MEAFSCVDRAVWRGDGLVRGERSIPEEVAVAFSYNGSSHAVMMATPQDLADFAAGFSLTEGVIGSVAEIESLDIVEAEAGIDLRMWLTASRRAVLQERRRFLAGPTGCGLCGIESLEEAMRVQAPVLDDVVFSPHEIMSALDALTSRQPLHKRTSAVHAAAFWTRDEGLLALREDVGRHNALDKLTGALAHMGRTGRGGLGIMTSRLSVELVQKAAAAGIPVLVAVSAPTALALRTAQAAGITIVAVARRDGFEVFTHPRRIAQKGFNGHVA